LKKLSVHALPGLCTLNIFEYEISLSCGKFRNHHREPLFGHGNTFDRGRPVVYTRDGPREKGRLRERFHYDKDREYWILNWFTDLSSLDYLLGFEIN